MSERNFGIIGLGVMGQNFALNLERNDIGVAVFDRLTEKTEAYMQGPAAGKNIKPSFSLKEFVGALAKPRLVMLQINAGAPVDAIIRDLVRLMDKDDLIIDAGNSHFQDTERRIKEVAEKHIHFLGMGVSGGGAGALWGPSLMPGGSENAYEKIASIMTVVAARAEEGGEACVTYIGPGGSGHYVKMVHNGIEYADMQLIAEAYDLFKRGVELSARECHEIFAEWNRGETSSFLLEITSKIFEKIDEETGKPLVDVVLDTAMQKGTGTWISQNALELGVAVPTITAAVNERLCSVLKEERLNAAKVLHGTPAKYSGKAQKLINAIRDALYVAKICAYAQGMTLLKTASEEYDYKLNLADIARIWRAGSVIRGRLLHDVADALGRDRNLANLLLDDHLGRAVVDRQDALRFTVKTAVKLGVPVPAMSASLAYYDSYRSGRLPANLIQAQRDYFGAHSFERIDRPGDFHAEWDSK